MSSIYKRGTNWQIKFMYRKSPHQLSLKTRSKTRARELQQQVDAWLDAGIFPNLDEIIYEPIKVYDISEYLSQIQDEIENNLSLAPSYRRRQVVFFKHFREFLKKENIRYLSQVKLQTAAKYRNWRLSMPSEKTKQTIAPKTVKEELMFFKNKVFERALDEDMISENPFRRALKDLKVYKREIQPFTEEEVQLLLNNAPNELHRDFYTTLYFTGSRFGEVANLEWDDIDLENKILYIKNKAKHRTKTRKSRQVPLHQKLEAALRQRQEKIDGKYIFPSPNKNGRPVTTLLKKFTQVRNSLGIDPVKTLHSFRHAFATHLQKKGVHIEIVQELLGHSDIRMTRHYQKVDLSTLREAVAKLG